jgi:carbamoyl-phosphate synthase large subunit
MSGIRVLVTGATPGGVGFGILEALDDAGYSVFATDITAYSGGLVTAEQGFVVPSAEHPDYLKTITAICTKYAIKLIVPGSEPELLALARNSARLESQGILLIANDYELIEKCNDKWKAFLTFRANGIPCPDSVLPDDYDAFIREHGFPILLKPIRGRGSKNLYVARNESEYIFYSSKLRESDVSFLLQEYVGTGSEEYTVGVVCRKDRSVVGSIAVRRLLEGISRQERIPSGDSIVEISTGITQGIVEDNKPIQQQCEHHAVRLGVTGPANFQGRLVNGVFVVFEVNARFSGTTPFRAVVGFNDVDMIIRDRLGQKVERPQFKTNVVLLRTLQNTCVPLEMIKRVEAASQHLID